MKSLSSASKRMWLITFSDLITLLITFYVLFFALSSTGVRDLKELIGFSHGGGEGIGSVKTFGGRKLFKKSGELFEGLEPLKASTIPDRIARFGEGEKRIDAITQNQGYLFSVELEKIFSNGSLTKYGEGILKALADILKNYSFEVRIRVYWKDPVNASLASSVIAKRLLGFGVDPSKVGVIGYKGKGRVEFFITPEGGYIYG